MPWTATDLALPTIAGREDQLQPTRRFTLNAAIPSGPSADRRRPPNRRAAGIRRVQRRLAPPAQPAQTAAMPDLNTLPDPTGNPAHLGPAEVAQGLW